MLDRRRLLLVAAAALVACGAPSPKQTLPERDVAATLPAKAPPDPDAAPLPLWPEIHKGTLPNGLTYYILKHGKPEHRALLWLAVNAGSVEEDSDQRGLAHFDEHMAFNGTRRFPRQDIISYLEKIGMSFGADVNAYTSWQQTVYQLEVPTDKEEYVGKGLDVLRDWAGDVTYDAAEVQKERGVVKEEWRLGRGAFKRLFDKQASVLYAGTRYADRITIGLPEIIDGAPREALVRYYKDWYRPDLMAVIAVGDVDPAKLEQEIAKRFGDLKNPANERPKVAAGVPSADGTRVSIETDREAVGTHIVIYNLVSHRPRASANDDRRLVTEQIYDEILNERLAKLGRRPDAPFLSAGAYMGGTTREIDAFTRVAQVKEGRTEDALRALFTEVLRVERHGFSQAELDRARAEIRRSNEVMAEREATTDSRSFTEEIVRNFLEHELIIGVAAERDLTLRFLPTITVADLEALGASYGADANRVITITGPDGRPLPTRERVLAIAGEVARSEILAWEDTPVPTSLMASAPPRGTIVKETTIESLGVTQFTLSNGARVIAKPTDFEKDSILLTALAPGGTALAKDADYNDAQFAVEVASAGGVGEIDADTLGKVLAGKQMTLSVSIGETTQGLHGSSTVKDLETMFQLLYLRVTAPRKDAEQIAVWRASRAERLANFERAPEFTFYRKVQAALFKDNPRRTIPRPADLEKVDADKALAFYRERFADMSGFTFVITGSFELAALRPLLETYVASLPGRHRVEKEKDLGIRKPGGVVRKEWQVGQEPKARVQIDFHADEAWTRDKERDLYILGQVLSIRLREVLREDLGGVYGAGAGGSLLRSPHQERTFTVQFGCDPARVDELVKAAFAEIGKLANAPRKPASAEDKASKDKKDLPIDDADLDDYLVKVKETFLRERETELRTNRFWSGWLAACARYGDDPTIVLDPGLVTARMTPANVRAAARRFLDGKQYFQAVMLPEKTPASRPKP